MTSDAYCYQCRSAVRGTMLDHLGTARHRRSGRPVRSDRQSLRAALGERSQSLYALRHWDAQYDAEEERWNDAEAATMAAPRPEGWTWSD
jgi:hypothetical protein